MRVVAQYLDPRVPKDTWGRGPWDQEPDKVQWLDEATDLDALAVRNAGGGLCGYVGVPPGHPWWEFGYGACTATPPCVREPTDYAELPAKLADAMRSLQAMAVRRCTDHWTYCEHSPGSLLDVHGGITFSEHGEEVTRARFDEWRAALEERRQETVKYPKGDMARLWRMAGDLITPDAFDAWARWRQQVSICHAPLPGREPKLWWFGFDCGHAWDYLPAHEALMGELLGERGPRSGTYRTLAYVHDEVMKLAQQLAERWPERRRAPSRRIVLSE